MSVFTIRAADENDVDTILLFIKGIAEYEKMTDEVVVDAPMLKEWLFDKKIAEVLFAVEDGKEVGFALFFPNYSTFVGRGGLYPRTSSSSRNVEAGYGKALFKRLAQIAVERNYYGSSGAASIGTSRASTSTIRSARSGSTNGRRSDSRATQLRGWREAKALP